MRKLPKSYIAKSKKDIELPLTILLYCGQPIPKLKSNGPLGLLDNNGSVLLKRNIDILKKKFPNADLIVSVGNQSDKYFKKLPQNTRFIENQLYESTSELEEFRLAINNSSNQNFLFIKENVFFKQNLFNDLDFSSSFVITSNIENENIGVIKNTQFISVFNYLSNDKFVNILYITENDIELFQKNLNNKYLLFELLNKSIDCGLKLKSYSTTLVKELNSIQDYNEIINKW